MLNSRPFIARAIHRLSVPIILAWLAITVVLTVGVPSLEQVESQHAVSLNPIDAPAFMAAKRVNEDFKQSDSGNLAVIVLEGQQPLGQEAHAVLRQSGHVNCVTIRRTCCTSRTSGLTNSPGGSRKRRRQGGLRSSDARR